MSGLSGLPGASISVGGAEISADIFSHISRVSVRSRMYGSDTFQIEFDAGPTFWQDENVFPLGAEIVIKMGQKDDLKVVHEGDVTAYFVEFLHRKGTKFMARGSDRSHRLHRVNRYKAYQAEGDSDVVKEMANAHGLTPEVDDAPFNGEVRLQFGQTDHAFIRERARRLGWLYRVEANKLYFKAPTFEDSGFEFDANKDILTFDLGLELTPVPTKVKVWGWDPWKKKPVTHEAKAGEEWWGPVAKSFGPKLSDKAFGENVMFISDMALPTIDEVKEIAQGAFQRMSEQAILGPVNVRGEPELKVGQTVTLNGLGKALEGGFLMQEITHTWTRDGMFSRLLVAKNALEL